MGADGKQVSDTRGQLVFKVLPLLEIFRAVTRRAAMLGKGDREAKGELVLKRVSRVDIKSCSGRTAVVQCSRF